MTKGEQQGEPGARRRLVGAHVVWALLVAATIPWRTGVYYEGGADSVVLAKALLSVTALLVAGVLAVQEPRRFGVPASPIVLILLYLGVTLIGAQNRDTLGPGTVVAVRVVILTLTISLLVTRFPPTEVAASLVHVLGVLVAAGTLSGLPSAASGRLTGAIPPLNPNELGFMASMCFLWTFAKMLTSTESRRHLLAAGACLAVLLLTGSRASLAALSVAALLMTLRTTALTRRSFAVVTLLGPILAYVLFGTDLLSSLFLRGGQRGVTTLSNRTIAWDAALTSDRGVWDTLFGGGLTQKHIEVPGQWWDTQLLDSSWVSAAVQSGLVGLTIVTLLSLSTFVRSLALPIAAGPFWLASITFLCCRGLLESGLFDATTSFMFFFLTALACRGAWAGSRVEPASLSAPTASR